MSIEQYARQSRYSDPGRYAALLDALPTDLPALTAVVRNVIVHYWAAGLTLGEDRLAEIDHRWVERMLATDQGRFPAPLQRERPESERVAGCCRDFTLLTVAALRHHGVPARSRIGFAGYFDPRLHHDHVIVDYWDGGRWVFVDPMLEPDPRRGFDGWDIPRLVGADPAGPPPFVTAAQAWTAYRRGEIDVSGYGVAVDESLRGGWFVRNYVIGELAHRQRDELLLWDVWGAMGADLSGDLGLIDEVAALLLAADDGDEEAERELAARYADDPRLRPADRVHCMSPTGRPTWVDLRSRESVPAVPADAVPAVPADAVPAVRADAVPVVRADGVSAVPADAGPA
jgi:hypothetical protein